MKKTAWILALLCVLSLLLSVLVIPAFADEEAQVPEVLGASIRTEGTQGLRFVGRIKKTGNISLTFNENANFGFFIVPESVTNGESITKDTPGAKMVKAERLMGSASVEGIGLTYDDDYYYFSVVQKGIPDEFYGTKLVVRAYVNDGGNYTYSNNPEKEKRSVQFVAQAIADLGGDIPAFITQILNTYAEVGNDILVNADLFGIPSKGLAFTSNGDGTCYVSGIGICTDTDVVIPPVSPDGDSVTGIGYEAFRGCTGLTSITIPDSVTSIGEGAFSGCSSLESMTIPFVGAKAGVTSSDTDQYPFGYIFGTEDYDGGEIIAQSYYTGSNYIFNEVYCIPKALKAVTVTGGNLLYHAFHNCTNIERIIVGDSVEYIDRFAFENCTGMTDVVVGKGVTTIDHATFQNCTGLENVVLLNGVTIIESYAFGGCSGLKSIIIPESVTNIGESAFSGCSSLKSILIPSSVTSIGEDAFHGCSNLEEITLPFAGKLVDYYRSTGCQGYYCFPYMFGINEYTNSKLIQVNEKSFPHGISSDMVWGVTGYYYIPIALKRVNICEPNSWLNDIQIENVEIVWDYAE